MAALAYEILDGSTEPVLAIHGLSSQRKLWNWLRAEAPEISLIAPDLRGRGESVAIGGPYSIAQHVADLVELLDQLGLAAVPVVGMSMGGFIAVRLAAAHPDRVKSLVLVDGGFPMAVPDGLTRDMVPAMFADRSGRLGRHWESVAAYADFFVSQTAPLLDPADPLLLDNLAHDLVDGRVRLSPDALAEDAADIFFGENPWAELSLPIRFVYAQWSTGVDSPPAYPPEAIERYRPYTAASGMIRGADHAATIMTRAGAAAVAEMVMEAL